MPVAPLRKNINLSEIYNKSFIAISSEYDFTVAKS